MPTRCFSVIKGERYRVVELDACGAPAYGSGRYVSGDGFVQVALSMQLEAGDEYIQKKANGKLCINKRNPDSLKRINVTIDWCEVDPDVISIITGFPVELDGADAVGFRIQERTFDEKWGLELWTSLGDEDCDAQGNPEFGYLLLPFLTGSNLGDLTIANAVSTFQTMGYTQGNSGWDSGPFPVLGAPDAETFLDDPIGPIDHGLIRVVSVPPPAVACGAQTLTSPTSTS